MIKIAQVQFSADFCQLEPIRQLVEKHAVEFGLAPGAVYDLTWSVTEIVTNVIQHGYHEKAGPVEIVLGSEDNDFIVQVRDEAPAFNPWAVPEPDTSLPLDKRPLGGLGLYMTRKMVDSLTHRLIETGGNEITLVMRNKNRS